MDMNVRPRLMLMLRKLKGKAAPLRLVTSTLATAPIVRKQTKLAPT
jgi:hypothetical protein